MKRLITAANSSLMTATNVEVSNHIPNDIVFSILSKLALKSLKRFGCVCKSWSLLFDDNCFMTMFRNNLLTKDHPYYDYTSVLIQTEHGSYYYNYKYRLHSLSGDNIVELDWPNPFPCPIQEEDNHPPSSSQGEEEEQELMVNLPVTRFLIVGSVSINGTLCLDNKYSENELLLWNPTTNEFKFIPSSPILSIPYYRVWSDDTRVGYDHVKDDYKVIRSMGAYTNPELPPVYFWDIYSLNNNTWSTIEADVPRSFDKVDVYTNGVCHWWGKTENHAYLVSFDFSNESFITTLIPSYVDDSDAFNYAVVRCLVLLNGSIALILSHSETSMFYISILGELGIKDSWTKLFIIGPLPRFWYPIGAVKKNKILFRQIYGGLALFDLSNKTFEEIGVIPNCTFCKTVLHKESNLPIGGINN
jgi:molecular chaperone HtpG